MDMNAERWLAIKKTIACALDSADEIDRILESLSAVPLLEWDALIEKAKPHRKTVTYGYCSLCGSQYETIRIRNADICDACQQAHITEIRSLNTHRYRARKAGLSDSLKLIEWLATLDHFNRMCAYCQINPYEVMDHFVPIYLGGGTVASNCIPCCEACNRKKKYTHPDKVKALPKAAVERVRTFISSLETSSQNP